MGDNFFGITDKGRQRTNNEDRFIAKKVFKGDYVLACVIDGVGGYVGGEVAAQLTADAIVGALNKLPRNMIDHMVAALEHANEKIMREKEISPQHEKMACVVTLAIVDIKKNLFYFTHVGDTRLYLFRDGSLIKITRDHSTVGFLEESGRLTEEAAMAHPKRNEVNKALGYETQIKLTKDFIDRGESPFLPGDTILLCSDGLTDMVPASSIIAILNRRDELKVKGQLLINAANEAGGRDNITVVLVQNDKSPVQHEVTKPQAVAIKSSGNGHGETKPLPEVKAYQEPVQEKGKSKTKIGPLLLILAVVIAVLAWLFLKDKKEKNAPGVVSPAPVKERTSLEAALMDSIGASPHKTVRLAASQSVVVTDSIVINNDSLHILGNGSSIVRDATYAGPAFVLSSNCKYVLLDSLTIDGFDVGLLVLGKGLHLRNVRFKNCAVPISFHQQLDKDIPVSGVQAAALFNISDSLHK